MAKLSVLYATALFELCEESGAENEFLTQAAALRDTLGDADTKRILVHPHIPAAEKQAFFGKAFEGKLHKDLRSFLYLTIDKNREEFFIPALSELVRMIERKQGKAKASVTSAAELSKKQTAELKKLLEEKLQKQVEIVSRVDPSVIGGPFILADGYIIDLTVKRRLRELTADMKI